MNSRVKVALINPGKKEGFAFFPPLNLGYIAGYLEKHGIEVRVIDELAGEDVMKMVDRFRPDIAGLTATTPLAPEAYGIAKQCRSLGILTVMGGVHASVLPEEALNYVDVVVKGEGERAMLDIATNGIRSGIVSRAYIKELDEIPPPAWHLMKTDFYFRRKSRLEGSAFDVAPPGTSLGIVMSSRGCPYNCIFCHNSWRGLPVRFHSPARVISEVKFWVEKYGVGGIWFMDDDLFLNKARLKEICGLIKESRLGISWGCAARVNDVDYETLRMVKEAGCVELSFGFESGSQKILDVLKKGTTTQENQMAVKLCKEVGIRAYGAFMVGNPTETIEDVLATRSFIRESGMDDAAVSVTTPFPGTELWRWCQEHNLIPNPIDWSKVTANEMSIPACQTIPPDEIVRLREEMITEIVQRRPLKFSRLLWRRLIHPIDTVIKLIRYPSKIPQTIRRLKI